MGDKDKLTKMYMRNPEKFADFFNGFIYSGKDVIDWRSLEEVDPTSLVDIPLEQGKKTSLTIQKIRDIIKSAIVMKDDDKFLVLLGIENQSEVHYAMPVRAMLYNALTYTEQVDLIGKNNDSKKSNDSATFLSGFTKYDRLKPVVTVTIYWGANSWDGPTTLKEMMGPMDNEVASFVDDCNINLFSIIDLDVVPEFKTRLRELFMLLSQRNKGSNFDKTLSGNAEYQKMDKETAQLISEFTKLKMPRKNKDGEYNMCKAVEEIKSESEARGETVGTIKTLASLVKDGLLSAEEAIKRSGISESEFEKYIKD